MHRQRFDPLAAIRSTCSSLFVTFHLELLMQSHFEINVSENGKHLFATAERDFTSGTAEGLAAVRALADRFQRAFPSACITISRYECVGHSVARQREG